MRGEQSQNMFRRWVPEERNERVDADGSWAVKTSESVDGKWSFIRLDRLQLAVAITPETRRAMVFLGWGNRCLQLMPACVNVILGNLSCPEKDQWAVLDWACLDPGWFRRLFVCQDLGVGDDRKDERTGKGNIRASKLRHYASVIGGHLLPELAAVVNGYLDSEDLVAVQHGVVFGLPLFSDFRRVVS